MLKFCLVYLKDKFLGHYYLTLTYAIFFTILMIKILHGWLMTILHVLAYQTWYLFLDSLQVVLIKHLTGLKKFLKRNADKCHLITSWKTLVGIEVSNITIISEEKVKPFGIHINNRLNFDYHISQFCKKAGKILHALTRIFKYMNISQHKLIANAFTMSPFSYCPLIWMLHTRAMEHKINRIHERTLKLIYPNQHQLTFKELLEKKQDRRHRP